MSNLRCFMVTGNERMCVIRWKKLLMHVQNLMQNTSYDQFLVLVRILTTMSGTNNFYSWSFKSILIDRKIWFEAEYAEVTPKMKARHLKWLGMKNTGGPHPCQNEYHWRGSKKSWEKMSHKETTIRGCCEVEGRATQRCKWHQKALPAGETKTGKLYQRPCVMMHLKMPERQRYPRKMLESILKSFLAANHQLKSWAKTNCYRFFVNSSIRYGLSFKCRKNRVAVYHQL